MFKHCTLLLSFFLLSLSIISCDRNEDLSGDEALMAALEAASPTGNPNFFKLPKSNEFDKIPQDANNPINSYKVALGKLLFHETAIGAKPRLAIGLKTYSCASCHHAAAGFQAGIAQGIGEGGIDFGNHGEERKLNPDYPLDSVDVQAIRSPSAMNVAYQKVMLWNGQFGAIGMNVGTEANWTVGTPKEKNNLGFEGVETQAIAGQGVHRLMVDHDYLASIPLYKHLFDNAFPEIPEAQRITPITCGLAIAAYERTLLANQAPFQKWLDGDNDAMNEQQKRGAALFFGKAECGSCHTGPALNSMAFYGLGMNNLQNGVYGAINSGPTKVEHKGRGGFTNNPEDMYKFKVPQLYNLRDAGFYGHGASFTSIIDIVKYKNAAIAENSEVPTSQLATEFVPLGLSADEIDDITEFLTNGLYDPTLSRYSPTSLPSDLCFPNNDILSRIDRGCE